MLYGIFEYPCRLGALFRAPRANRAHFKMRVSL